MNRNKGSKFMSFNQPKASRFLYLNRTKGLLFMYLNRSKGSRLIYLNQTKASRFMYLNRTKGLLFMHLNRSKESTLIYLNQTKGSRFMYLNRTKGFSYSCDHYWFPHNMSFHSMKFWNKRKTSFVIMNLNPLFITYFQTLVFSIHFVVILERKKLFHNIGSVVVDGCEWEC